MRYIVLFALVTLMLSSCSDKTEELENLNKAPRIEYFDRASYDWKVPDNNILVDSFKINTDSNNLVYSVAFRIKDANKNLERVEIERFESGEFFFNGELLTQNYFIAPTDSFSISYRGKGEGLHAFKIKAADDFDKLNEILVHLNFNQNKKPVALLELGKIGQLHPNEYLVDGSGSKDIDKDVGGQIITYEYTINGVEIETTRNKLKHIFNPGANTITLRVRDNDNAWSETVTVELDL